jgi:hypothetical protein
VLLPPPDDLEPLAVGTTRDYFTQLLPIDLVPVFFLATAAIFGVLLWREYRLRKPKFSGESTHRLGRKQVAPFHVVIEETHEFLARTGIVAMVGSIGVWLVLAAAVFAASNHGWGKDEWVVPLMVGLKIAGLVLLVIIVARRPARVAYGLRQLFGSLADIAGFWAPDLHPLAAASYRRAVLRGIELAYGTYAKTIRASRLRSSDIFKVQSSVRGSSEADTGTRTRQRVGPTRKGWRWAYIRFLESSRIVLRCSAAARRWFRCIAPFSRGISTMTSSERR